MWPGSRHAQKRKSKRIRRGNVSKGEGRKQRQAASFFSPLIYPSTRPAASVSLPAILAHSLLSFQSSASAAHKLGGGRGGRKKTQDALAHCTCSFDPPCCPWAVKENFWQAVSGVTGNLVGLSGDGGRKFERHLEFFGGFFFPVSSFFSFFFFYRRMY